MILASRILFHTHEQQIKRSPTPPLTVQSRSRMKIRQGNFVLVFYSNLKSCEMRLDPNHGTIINFIIKRLENSSHNGEKMKSLQIEICSQLSVSKNVKEMMKIAQIPVKSETDSYPDIAVIFHDSLVANHETLLSGIEGDEDTIQEFVNDEEPRNLISPVC
jgi:hypothetical protein